MKKSLLMLVLTMGMLSLGITQAHATLPTVDGSFSAAEWDSLNSASIAYPYYLEVTDPNEADNAFDNTDISRAVVLQELTDGPNGSGDANYANDGIYILLQVYAPPPTLDWQSVGIGGIGITGIPTITMQGDLLGDGLSDGFNIFLRHYNTDPTAGVGVDKVEVCVGSSLCLANILPWTDLVTAGGSFSRGSVLEYYIPSGTFGTPPSPPGTSFPSSFVGQLTYDNGLGGPNTSDDIVIGHVAVPEPSTMFLTVTGLLSLLGAGKFKLWK